MPLTQRAALSSFEALGCEAYSWHWPISVGISVYELYCSGCEPSLLLEQSMLKQGNLVPCPLVDGIRAC